jgi:hypothetical protein
MEPFGLLNLLKSLLPQAENQTQNHADFVAKTENNSTESTPPIVEKNTLPPIDTPPPNAFLDYVERHEQHKKNVKKP